MATLPALLAGPPGTAGRGNDLRRPARPPGGRDEPGRRPAVDPLARPGHPRAARGRQRLLHGLSLPAAPHPRPSLAAGSMELAAATPEQVAGGAAAGRLPVRLRGAGPLGPAGVDGVPGPRLLR